MSSYGIMTPKKKNRGGKGQKFKHNKREKYFKNKSQLSLGFPASWLALHLHVGEVTGPRLQKLSRTTTAHHYLK